MCRRRQPHHTGPGYHARPQTRDDVDLNKGIRDMTEQISTLAAAQAFVRSLEQRDLDIITPHLADGVVETVPLSMSGEPGPLVVFDGKEQVLGYLNTILDNFSQVVLRDAEYFVANDGGTVFMEAKGDLVQAGTDTSYRNTYVFKFELSGGSIDHIVEYANPVTYAKLMGLPIG
jgi:ketosteroid isomerase-like protein